MQPERRQSPPLLHGLCVQVSYQQPIEKQNACGPSLKTFLGYFTQTEFRLTAIMSLESHSTMETGFFTSLLSTTDLHFIHPTFASRTIFTRLFTFAPHVLYIGACMTTLCVPMRMDVSVSTPQHPPHRCFLSLIRPRLRKADGAEQRYNHMYRKKYVQKISNHQVEKYLYSETEQNRSTGVHKKKKYSLATLQCIHCCCRYHHYYHYRDHPQNNKIH